MDERFLSVVRSAQDASDNALFRAFADDLAGCGITIREQMELLPELTAGPGVLTSREPTEEEWRDVRFAFRMAKGLAQLDIGQTVVVKRQAVLAVRPSRARTQRCGGAQLGRGDVVACKVAKPDQDPRFDLPTVGPDTVRTMAECGVRVLAFEAHRTILVDREKMQDVADGAGVSLVAVESGFEEEERLARMIGPERRRATCTAATSSGRSCGSAPAYAFSAWAAASWPKRESTSCTM